MVSTVTASSVAGFQGKVNDQTWALLAQSIGVAPHVPVRTDLAPLPTASTRQVTVAAGSAYSRGTRATWVTQSTLDIPSPSSGGQYQMIAIHRRAADKLAELVLLPGPTGPDADVNASPTANPAGYLTNLGVEDHQPIAWVYARAGRSTVQVFDLRLVRSGTGAMEAMTLSAIVTANTYLQDGAELWMNVVGVPAGQIVSSVWKRFNGTFYAKGRTLTIDSVYQTDAGQGSAAQTIISYCVGAYANVLGVNSDWEALDNNKRKWYWNGSYLKRRADERTLMHVRYDGYSDQILAGGGWMYPGFDTNRADPEGWWKGGYCQVPIAGRYEVTWRGAVTNYFDGNQIMLSLNDPDTNADFAWEYCYGLVPDRPRTLYAQLLLNTNQKIRPGIYQSQGQYSNWLRRGAGFFQLAPEFIVRYLGEN